MMSRILLEYTMFDHLVQRLLGHLGTVGAEQPRLQASRRFGRRLGGKKNCPGNFFKS